MASTADARAKIVSAISELEHTTSSGSAMVAQHGTDVAKWPSGHWRNAMLALNAALAEIALLHDPVPAILLERGGLIAMER